VDPSPVHLRISYISVREGTRARERDGSQLRCSIFSHLAAMVANKGERVRLYVRATILGYKRSKSNQYPTTSLLQIEGVNTPEEVNWYLGKRLAYVYKAKTKKNGSLYRCTWGKVARPHGNSGVVRARFRKNLPPASLGAKVRVFMYPSRI
jgi:large subunit ribosomal protein L35Ae